MSIKLRLPLIAASVLLWAAIAGATPSASSVSFPPDPPVQIRNWVITEAGCCSGFSWSDDGADVTFFDHGGLWRLDPVTRQKTFESPAPGLSSPSGRYLIERTDQPNSAVITDTLLNQTWDFRLGGPSLEFSREEDRVAFSVRPRGFLPSYARLASIYVASVDASDSLLVTRMFGGPIGWFPDGERLLLSGRQTLDDPAGIWIYNLKSGELSQIVTADFVRRASISPTGRFIAFVRSFAEDPSDSGLWIHDTATATQRRIAVAGSYRWHPSGRGLLIIPPRSAEEGDHAIWWADIAGGEPVNLTESGSKDFRISNFEWQLSPDGRRAVYRHADNLSLWIVDFGQALDQVFGGSPSAFAISFDARDPNVDWDAVRR